MERYQYFFQERLLPLLTDQTYLFSFAIIAALLAAAQGYNHLRMKSASASPTHAKVAVIISSWWKILLFSFFAFWGGSYTLLPTFFVLTLLTVKEYFGISALKESARTLFPLALLGVVIHYASFILREPFLFFASFHFFVLAVLMPAIVWSKRAEILAQLIAALLALMIITVFLSFPVAVMVFESGWIGSEIQARQAILLLIVLTQVNDILQFLNGKLFGRRQIVPWVSPNKTEAGFLGGLFFSSLLGLILWPLVLPIGHQEGLALGAILSIGGMMGDLVCSAAKRHRGVKDFSDLIPGHGGVLDRLDSLLVTAPLFYFTIRVLEWV